MFSPISTCCFLKRSSGLQNMSSLPEQIIDTELFRNDSSENRRHQICTVWTTRMIRFISRKTMEQTSKKRRLWSYRQQRIPPWTWFRTCSVRKTRVSSYEIVCRALSALHWLHRHPSTWLHGAAPHLRLSRESNHKMWKKFKSRITTTFRRFDFPVNYVFTTTSCTYFRNWSTTFGEF